MKKNKNSISPEKEEDLSIEMFNVLVQKEIAVNASREPGWSMREKNRRYAEAEKLEAQFERLAKIAEGETLTRERPKGEAYALALYYLNKFPDGSLTVSKPETPSLFKFAKEFEGLTDNDRILTCSGELEIETVVSPHYILMGLNGEPTKEFKLNNALKVGFKRAKDDLKKTRISKGSDPLI